MSYSKMELKNGNLDHII